VAEKRVARSRKGCERDTPQEILRCLYQRRSNENDSLRRSHCSPDGVKSAPNKARGRLVVFHRELSSITSSVRLSRFFSSAVHRVSTFVDLILSTYMRVHLAFRLSLNAIPVFPFSEVNNANEWIGPSITVSYVSPTLAR